MKVSSESVVKDIRRRTHKKYSLKRRYWGADGERFRSVYRSGQTN